MRYYCRTTREWVYRARIDPGTMGIVRVIIHLHPRKNGSYWINESLKILNASYIDVPANDLCDDPLNLRYDISFRLDNNLPPAAGNAFEVSLTKVSDYGAPFFQEWGAADNANITRPTQ